MVLILLCEEVSEEFQSSLTESISSITTIPFSIHWNTWKGLYALPAEGGSWSSKEIVELGEAFESHPQVWGVEVSSGQGSVG